MSAVNLSKTSKHKRKTVNSVEQRVLQEHDDLLDLFPLPRYFQVHFQHIHDRTGNFHKELTDLKLYVNNLETKLDALLMLVSQQVHEYK